jgi:hypothetical protein
MTISPLFFRKNTIALLFVVGFTVGSLWAQSPLAPISPLSEEMTLVEVKEAKGKVSIENKLIRVIFDLDKGHLQRHR